MVFLIVRVLGCGALNLQHWVRMQRAMKAPGLARTYSFILLIEFSRSMFWGGGGGSSLQRHGGLSSSSRSAGRVGSCEAIEQSVVVVDLENESSQLMTVNDCRRCVRHFNPLNGTMSQNSKSLKSDRTCAVS